VGLLVVILTLALIALVVALVSAPLRRARSSGDSQRGEQALDRELSAAVEAHVRARPVAGARTRDELEAAREAKYREIRDAELDFRTGKLSREDYQRIDVDLRAEAIEILDALEALRPREP
jgi:hypothetical protein